MNPEHYNRDRCFLRGWQGFACFTLVFVAWGIWEKWGEPWFRFVNPDITVVAEAAIIKNLIWLLPAAVYVLRGFPLKWSLRDLFSRRVPWIFVFICFCAMLAALHTIWLITYKGSAMIMPYSFVFVLLSVCAGFSEELLFRGILLNGALEVYPVPVAVVITNLYFVLIHFTPLLFGASPAALLSIRGLQIFLMGSFFSVVLMRTRNIIVPMLLHTIWNAIAYFYGLY